MSLHLEYFIFVTISSIGVIQLSATYGSLTQILIFRSKKISSPIGILLTFSPILWFFHSGGRAVPDTDGGVAGFSQFLLFSIGSILALFFTFSISSIINHKNRVDMPERNLGLLGLRNYTYLQLINGSFGVGNWILKTLTKKYSP